MAFMLLTYHSGYGDFAVLGEKAICVKWLIFL